MRHSRPRPSTDWQLDKGKPLWTAEDAEYGAEVRAAVDRLPEPHRSVVELRMWGRLTFREIAEEMGMNGRQNAFDHYQRGLTWLRTDLHEHSGGWV